MPEGGWKAEGGREDLLFPVCSLFLSASSQQHFLTLAASNGSICFHCAFFSHFLRICLVHAQRCQQFVDDTSSQNLNPSSVGSLIQSLEAPAPGQQCSFLKLAHFNNLYLFLLIFQSLVVTASWNYYFHDTSVCPFCLFSSPIPG